MSNFNPSNIQKDLSIINNIYSKSIDIYSSDITNNNSKNYKIAYDNGSDTNFYYSKITPSYYTAKNIYLYGLLHNNIIGLTVSNDNIIGELVIEHTNNFNKVYTCYLLQKSSKPINKKSSKYNTSPPKNIDDIINFVFNSDSNMLTGLVLNNIIGDYNKIPYIYYKDTTNPNNNIFIYTKPIIINNTDNINFLSNLSNNTNLFSINAPLQQTMVNEYFTDNTEGFTLIEGLKNNNNKKNNNKNKTQTNDNDIYIDCTPTGVSSNDIKTYNLPINSNLIGEKQQMDFINTSINFLLFTFVVFIIYFTVPSVYKKIVIDKVNKMNGIDILTRIRSIDIWISLFIFILCYILFTDGFDNNNGNSLIYGLFVVIIFCVSVSLIQSNKSDPTYMKTIINGCSPKGEIYDPDVDVSKYIKITDIIDTLIAGIKFYFLDVLKLNIALFVICALITFFIYYSILNKTKFSDMVKPLSFIATMLIPISIIIKLYIS
jgi:hypothetical protein